MHLRNVELFCDVALRRSFSKAAEAHKISQSSASQAIHMLEKRLGVQLIDRSKRPLELTPAGQVYLDGCRALLDEYRKIEDRLQQMKNKVIGRVRVAAIYSVGLLQMDSYARRFHQLYPEADVHVEYLHPDEVYTRLQNDEFDLGLVSFPQESGEIASIPWQTQEMVVVVPADHPLAHRTGISAEELAGADFVAFTSELPIRRNIDRWLRHAKIAVNIVHEFDNTENIKRAVEIGSGIALLPLQTVGREVKLGSLAALHMTDVQWSRPLGIVHKRHKTFATAVSKFVDLLHEDPETFRDETRDTSSKRGHRAVASDSQAGRRRKRESISEATS